MGARSTRGIGAPISRRGFLQLAGAGVVLAGTGAYGLSRLGSTGQVVGPSSTLVAAAEASRATTGAITRRTLRAAPTTLDLAGRQVATWAYGGASPTAEIRMSTGDRLLAHLDNALPAETTVHWHGIALRNDMDGVPGLTQDAVGPGGGFDYGFVVPDPGTYWFHPHMGVQLDMGLHGALVVEDPHEPLAYDEDHVVMLDDWTDGWGESPDQILTRMRAEGMTSSGMGAGMGSMTMGGTADSGAPLGSDAGDQPYPAHLINGRVPADPWVLTSTPGTRVRLRFINAGSDTAYRVALTGHRMRVTHADGWPVQPVEVDALLIGMGERYDVLVTLGDGAFALVAAPEGKQDPQAVAVVRTAAGTVPDAGSRPAELDRRVLTYEDLVPSEAARLSPAPVDHARTLQLAMQDGGRVWTIDGRAWPDHDPVEVAPGQRLRLTVQNMSMMFHPVHLHGHTFALVGGASDGLRKDTVNVLPMGQVTVDIAADNPGRWALHCHNTYHAELGMMTLLDYVT